MNVKNEREDNGKLDRGTDSAQRIENKSNAFRKAEKLLVEGLSVAFVVAGLGLAVQGCGSAPSREDAGDARTTRLDGYTSPEEELDGEIEEELDGEEADAVTDMPDAMDDDVADLVEEDAATDGEMDAAPDAEEDADAEAEEDGVLDGVDGAEEDAVSDAAEDATVDPLEEDAIEDFISDLTEEAEEDVISDLIEDDVFSDVIDVADEDAVSDVMEDAADDETWLDVYDEDITDLAWDEVETSCSTYDDVQTLWIAAGSLSPVGGIEVRYTGTDTSGRAIYDILCGGVVVRGDVIVDEGATVLVDVSEQGFTVSITSHIARSWGTNSTINVNAHEVPEIADDADVVEGDVAEEDVGGDDHITPTLCSVVDETSVEWISNGGKETVGNITIKYKGIDTSGNGIYDILCRDTAIRSDVIVGIGATVTVEVPEEAFRAALTPILLYSWGTNVIVNVDAY